VCHDAHSRPAHRDFLCRGVKALPLPGHGQVKVTRHTDDGHIQSTGSDRNDPSSWDWSAVNAAASGAARKVHAPRTPRNVQTVSHGSKEITDQQPVHASKVGKVAAVSL
jgi:hypothetical protein